jgi:hypothetical protein
MSESPLTSSQAVKLLDKNIGKYYWDRYKGLPIIIDKLFDRVKSKKAWEEFQSVGSLPDPQLFNGVIQMQNFSMGYHTKIVPLEYAGGFILERLLIDTDQSGIIKKLPQQLATAANRKMNKIAHEPFIYPDSSSFTFMTSEEGVALASNSHTFPPLPGLTTSLPTPSTQRTLRLFGFRRLASRMISERGLPLTSTPSFTVLRLPLMCGKSSTPQERLAIISTTPISRKVDGSPLNFRCWTITARPGGVSSIQAR